MLAVIAVLLFGPPPGWAQGTDAEPLNAEVLEKVFPGGGVLGAFSGQPLAAPVYRDGKVAGYVFSTRDTVGTVGFSGKPIDILVGLENSGRIIGAYLRHHSEPILIIGIPPERLSRYVTGFAGVDVTGQALVTAAAEPEWTAPDMISGATVSSAVIRDGIFRAARAVAGSRGLMGGSGGARLDRETFEEASWAALIEDGTLAGRRLTQGQVREVLGEPPDSAGPGGAGLFVDLLAGLITPPRAGENLIGKQAFNRLLAEMAPDDQIIAVAANGLYSFKGTQYVRSGTFDRIQVVQAGRTIRLTRSGYRNIERFMAAGSPEFREIGVFIIAADTGFDPLEPWRLDLLVSRETESGSLIHAGFSLDYSLPNRYRAGGGANGAKNETFEIPGYTTEIWRQVWIERSVRIVFLGVMLAALTAILVFQDSVVRNQRFYRWSRLTFLAFTVGWLGWYAGGQLSVVNVLTFIHSLLGDFHWEFFLLDPIIFLLWGYVAITLLFWGRGVFCGWLCPFGALQELVNEAARKLRIPQITVPFVLHERLWPIKYIIFLGLLAVSLHSTSIAVVGAEVEPFKTAITLKFMRAWPFVLYAFGLLVCGLTIERFYCRYLCPLGAALAIPARLRMFDWLKRRFQCGHDCRICADRCTVQAIHPDGAINPNECIHCLNCQTFYFDSNFCPPLVAQRKRRERRAQLSGGKSRFGGTQDAENG